MKRAFALLALATLSALACSDVTAPTVDLTPVVDSISPALSRNVEVDGLTGHVVSEALPVFVRVYGRNLAGGTVHFGIRIMATDSARDGALDFTAPVTVRGTIPVYVSTAYGISNLTVFVRR